MDEVITERQKQINNEEIPKGYKLAGKIGVVPIDWEVKKFNEVFKINQGLQIPISKRLKEPKEDSYFYITNEFIKNTGNDGKKYYIQNPSKSVICTKDDILMTRTGNTGIVLTNVEGVFHNNFFKINYDRNLLNKNFVYYYLKSEYVQKMIKIYAGINTISDLNHSDFYRIDFLFMGYKEQQKIASILSTWDKTIELKEKLIEQKKEQKKGLMQKLLTGVVRLQGFEGEWKSVKIKEVCNVISGGTPSTQKKEYWNGSIPWCIPTDITSSGKYIQNTERLITNKGLKNSSANLLPKNSILMCSRATIGPRSINKIAMATNQGFKSFVCKEDKLDYEFFYYLLFIYESRFKRLANGSTFLEVSKKDVENTKIFIPKDVNEQKEIGSILCYADKEIELLNKEINELKLQKKGLMQRLLTGKVRVKV